MDYPFNAVKRVRANDPGGRLHASAGRAASFASPALDSLANSDSGDHKRGQRIQPPQAEQRVPQQSDEDGSGEVRA